MLCAVSVVESDGEVTQFCHEFTNLCTVIPRLMRDLLKAGRIFPDIHPKLPDFVQVFGDVRIKCRILDRSLTLLRSVRNDI